MTNVIDRLCERLTDDVEFEEVSRRYVGEGDLNAVGGDERLVEAAHDVDLCPLRQLLFAPDHRIVEQRVRRAAERAFQSRRATFIHDVELRIGQQRHVVRVDVVTSWTHRWKQKHGIATSTAGCV